jgi:hypothetical protein
MSKNVDSLEKLAKQSVPLIWFWPLRLLTGIAWIYWGLLVLNTLTGWAVIALIAGILLFIGLFARFGAFLGTALSYIAYFENSLAHIAPAFSAFYFATWPLLFVDIALMFWTSGRVLGLDKFVVEKAPIFAKIRWC